MTFIRVTDAASKTKFDVNSVHITSHTPFGEGSKIRLADGEVYSVLDTPRSIRSYIKKAQGNLPAVPVTDKEDE